MELFIEKYRVDVNKTFSTLLTLAIDDIKDFGSKNTTFSKTIILPGTNNNNKLFGSIFETTARQDYNPLQPNVGLNFNAATSARALIFVDNIQVFKGTLRVLEIINDNGFIEYECAVFGELGGLVASIGNAKLEDLDFSAYNHTYNLTNIVASWDNLNAGVGYCYPLIDYGTYSTAKKDWNYRTFRPAFFAKEYIDKIFANAGYTFDSTHLNTTRVKSWVIPHNKKTLTRKSALTFDVSRVPDTVYVQSTADNVEYKQTFNTLTTLGDFTPSGSNTIFTYTGAAKVANFKVTLNVDYDNSMGLVESTYIRFHVGASSYDLASIFEATDPLTGNINTIITPSLTINPSAQLYATVRSDDPLTPLAAIELKFNIFKIEIIGTTGELVPINLNEPVIVNETLPQNILQKDFLSSILKLSNLYVFEDADNDKLLKIEPFIDFYANAQSEDWSLKLDRSKTQRTKPMSELNSRYYEFNYKDDSDYYNDLYKKRYNQGYGSYKYDSQFEFSKESTKVEIIFSGTPLVGYTGEDKVYSTIFKKSGIVEENVDSVIRILQAKKITGVTTWHIRDAGGGSLHNSTVYPYAGHLDDPDSPSNDLNFGVPKELFFTLVAGALNVNQFNVYWSSYMAEITDKDSRLLTAYFKLDFKDIYNIDFSKLKWIDGVLYRLNKIEDFNVTDPTVCKCELLKVINKIY